MKKFLLSAAALTTAFLLGYFVPRAHVLAADTMPAQGPASGWNLHVDATHHFGAAHPMEIAHHWCKAVDGFMECQIYDSDAPNARLVAVETIIPPKTYSALPADEQALWHYHKTEIPKVDVTFPGMTPEQAKQTTAAMLDTYGKVWVLFDPMSTSNMPTGKPWVSILQ